MRMNSLKEVKHTFAPVYDENSRVLILGTMPSVRSRAENFYYMHPQNLFWKVLSCILGEQIPQTVEMKKEMLFNNHIAIWDVLESCEIEGSQDHTIKNPKPNDIKAIIDKSQIRAIFTNGSKATELYKKHCISSTGMESIRLPSTSPANKKDNSFEKMCSVWNQILGFIK